MFRAAGTEELQPPKESIHSSLAEVQKKMAVLPDYGFPKAEEAAEHSGDRWPVIDKGTSLSGVIGGALTLFLAGMLGVILKRRRKVV
jgi:cobalt/nickel transport system permease protein